MSKNFKQFAAKRERRALIEKRKAIPFIGYVVRFIVNAYPCIEEIEFSSYDEFLKDSEYLNNTQGVMGRDYYTFHETRKEAIIVAEKLEDYKNDMFGNDISYKNW